MNDIEWNQKITEQRHVDDLQTAVLHCLSDNYVVVYVIRLEDNSFASISSIEKVDHVVSRFQNAQAAMDQVVDQVVRPKYLEDMHAFVDLKTLPRRLKDRRSVTMDYQGSLSGWCCASFRPVSYDENGELKDVLYTVEHINDRKMPAQIYQKTLESNAELIYYFDLTDGSVGRESSRLEQKLIPVPSDVTLPMQYDQFVERYFAAIGWQSVRDHDRIYTRNEILDMYDKGTMRFRTEYYAQTLDRYYSSEFYLSKNEENEHIIAMVVRTDITEEYRREEEARNTLSEIREKQSLTRMALMAFAESYANVYIVDLARNEASIVKQDGYLPMHHVYLSDTSIIYDSSIEGYIRSRVAEEDRDRMRLFVSPENIKQSLAERAEYSFPYHIMENGEIHDYECRIIRTEREGKIVLGFANIDALMVEEKRQKEIYRQAMEGMQKSKIYLDAISSSYNYMVIYNLTQDTYTIPINHNVMGWDQPESGRYSELLEVRLASFPAESRGSKGEMRRIDRQLELYRSGKGYWEEQHQLFDASGELHWIQERVVYTANPENGDVLGISLSRVIDEERQKEAISSQITVALSRDYTNVYLLNPRKDQITPVVLKGYAVEGLDRTLGSVSPYWALVEAYAQARVFEEDRERFFTSLSPAGIEKALKEREEHVFPYRIVEDGVVRDYQVKIIRTEMPGVYIFAFKNIDALLVEERKRQKLYEEALADAERANRAKRDFLARMSHDIRMPINGIVGMTHIMKTEMENPERLAEGIGQIEQLSHQLELLINDVLDMSRIESGKIELSRENFDLRESLRGVLPSIYALAAANGVVIEEMHVDIRNKYVIGSPSHIQRICMNVISNAIKYNREGGSVFCELIEHPLDEKHSSYAFKVTDTGIGMSEEFQRHIFEPFAREHENPETDYSGTGLGMAITREFVEMLGGTIEIESRQGVGTTVRYTLPLELGEAITGEKYTAVSLKGKRVLLVEDNRMNLRFARFLLEEEQATVDVAGDGQEAVDIFAASPEGSYDLILMDVMMPVMDGIEATEIIRGLHRADAKTVPILAMSANAFVEDVQRCMDAGMNAHIAKPLDIGIMKEKIARNLQ